MNARRSEYPGARRPDRSRVVDSGGVGIATYEWGDEDAPPLLLAHGGLDFAATFDRLAPLLADAGWRVVSWDARGHGDSERAVLYSWEADVRDAVAVLDTVSRAPVPFIGHSKGGGVMMQLADGLPHRCSHFVNLDGMPSRRSSPDVTDHERTRLLRGEMATWLDHRFNAATKERRAGTIDELAERRQKMNPRLPIDWLRYIVPIGASHDDDGWRWKLDPVLRFGGFGPWRPEWSMMRMPGLAMPVLGILATSPEPLGWNTLPKDVEPWLPPGARLVSHDDVGHFLHVEKPDEVAGLVLEFLDGNKVPRRIDPPVPAPDRAGAGHWPAVAATPPSGTVRTVELPHARSTLALHCLREGSGRALLHLHGLGEQSPDDVPEALVGWPGPIWALDFTGHGCSTIPKGGGYGAEVLMADVATALRHLGEATLFGRGLGAYVALLASGACVDDVRGTILFDGPGLLGGGSGPGAPWTSTPDPRAVAPPDPFALVELSRDVRPPDYATTYARLALQASPLDHPITVSSVNRPSWLAAVASEPGVLDLPLADALAAYAEAV